MKQFSCVIFDVDGTLTRTNDLIFASFNHVTAKYASRTLSPAEIIALFGPPEEGAIRQVLPEHLVADAMEDLCSFYEGHHDAMAHLHHGLRDGLHALRAAGVRLAVFTGKGRRTAMITLKKFGIVDCFDLVVSGNDVEHHKPAADGINLVLRTFNVDPSSVLMVGDSLGDLQASRGAGVQMAAVLWDSYDRTRLLAAGPDYSFDTVPEFMSWLLPHTANAVGNG